MRPGCQISKRLWKADALPPKTKLIEVETDGPRLYEITNAIRTCVQGDGIVHLLVLHTSCSLLIQENADPEVQTDLQNFFGRLVPPSDNPSMGYLKHTYEGPDDMPAHIKAAMMPVSLTIPVMAGRLVLGTWQGIYLFEHRSKPHIRKIAVTLCD